MNRREMLATLSLAAAATPLSAAPLGAANGAKAGLRIFDVTEFGATGDGKTLDTASINRAVDACHSAGGGMVYLPPGTYLSGTVILQSNVTLYVEAGATLLGSKSLADFSPQPGPAAGGDAGQNHLIFARDAEDLGIAGPGKIDGQGTNFWVPNGRVPPPPGDDWRDTIPHGWKPLPRPSPMLEFYNCKNLRISDMRIENSPGWTLRPINCDNVFIRGIKIKNPVYGCNTDGIDPTCCHNLFISDCLIDTGDDAICLKSENPYGGDLRVSKNITITNCVMSGCCNGIKFGTATHGGYENVVISNCVVFNDDVPYSSRIECGIAIEMVDGGWIEGVVISNIRLQRSRTPIFIRRGARRVRPDGTPGTLRGVMIDNVHASNAILTSLITGLPGFEVEDVTLSNIYVETEEAGKANWVNREIPELPKAYPGAISFGRLPSFGLYARHTTGLRLRNQEFKSAAKEARPAIFCEDVKDLDIVGLRSLPIVGTQPTVKLVQTKQAFLQSCSAPAGTKIFLEVNGDKSEGIVLTGSNLLAAQQAAQSSPDVPKDAVTVSGNVTKS